MEIESIAWEHVGAVTVARVDGECVLGRPDLALYVAVPEPGAVFVEALQAGATLVDATERASAVAGSEVDGQEFLEGLTAAGFFSPPASASGTGQAVGGRGRRIRWIEGVGQPTAQRLFGRTAWSIYGAAGLFAAVLWVLDPPLRPSFEHSWWLPDPIMSVLVLTPIAWVLRAVHEAWHWLAGRAVGVPASFRISYRGAFLVFETDLSQIVSIPRRRRYGAFLAGMAVDTLVMSAALAARWANQRGVLDLPGSVDRLLAAVVLVQFFSIAWQFFAVFMRSDSYAILANVLGCHDLYRATWLTTKDRLWGLGEPDQAELQGIGARDRQVARWFGFIYVGGMIAMVWLVFYLAVPFLIGVVSWVGESLTHPDPRSWPFWSSLTLVCLLSAQRAAPVVLALRERRLRQAGVLR